MTTAYLLGAGASRGYRRSRTGVSPPLAKDYFSTFSKLLISGDFEVKIGEIVNYIRDERGIPPEAQPTDFDENIESIFAEVERELRLVFDEIPDPDRPTRIVERFGLVKTYDQFVLWFAHVLNEIQNGDVDDAYAALVNRVAPRDALITFNWDTLLDRALFESGHWFPDDGYGASFDGFIEGTWRNPKTTKSALKLLKLHGSTNWLGPYVSRHLQTGARTWIATPETAYKRWCLVDGSNHFDAYKDRWRPGYKPFSYFFPPNDPLDDLPLMPIIVPPQEHKDFRENGTLFEPIWNSAREALAAAERLVVIGYSFPQTDGHAFALLDSFLSGPGRTIELIDPYPDGVADRVRKHVGGRADIIVRPLTLRAWLGLSDETATSETEMDRVFADRERYEREQEELFRRQWLIVRLIEFNLDRTFFDITRYSGEPLLNCKLVGEFATHLYGAYRPEVASYRLSHIPVELEDGTKHVVALSDIWTVVPFGAAPLTEEAIAAADIASLPEGVKEMIKDAYRPADDAALERQLRRFAAAPEPDQSAFARFAEQTMDLLDRRSYAP